MTATYNNKESTININHRKENNFAESYIGLLVDNNEINEVVEMRFYYTDSTAYCCLWVADNKTNTYTNGSGKAGGYGYHRPSSAAQEAIKAAGFTLSESIDGRGDSSIREAVKAICEYFFNGKTVHIVHAHA